MTITQFVTVQNILQFLKISKQQKLALQHLLKLVFFAYELDSAIKVLVTTIDAQWEGMGDVGSARYMPALLPPCPTIRVLSYSN